MDVDIILSINYAFLVALVWFNHYIKEKLLLEGKMIRQSLNSYFIFNCNKRKSNLWIKTKKKNYSCSDKRDLLFNYKIVDIKYI